MEYTYTAHPLQVCIPFLFFCLGVDPKLDTTRLPTILADLGSRPPASAAPLPPSPLQHKPAPDERGSLGSLGKENVPKVSQDGATHLGSSVGQDKLSETQDASGLRAGRVLSLLATPFAMGNKRRADRYQSTPKLSLVLSGCHAVLQFLGETDSIQGSLLETGEENTVLTYCMKDSVLVYRPPCDNWKCSVCAHLITFTLLFHNPQKYIFIATHELKQLSSENLNLINYQTLMRLVARHLLAWESTQCNNV